MQSPSSARFTPSRASIRRDPLCTSEIEKAVDKDYKNLHTNEAY